ncbi:hypothetical protein [Paraburkholderia sp. J11-2]|uniref:hypothetical protein n=1 Tax=Paraburkholderia sp. J11-2 TaxID=2805431 RepID=UPI002AB78884|nr:hypothetical protein [Paraburkholderia sp. J11-2]
MSDKPLKAYQVDTDDGDGGSCVVFTTNSATARREGASILDADWESVTSCRRKPHFDAYSPGPVPASALIESGWRFECSHCYARVTNDYTIDDDGNEVEPSAYVTRGQKVFCHQECIARYDAKARMNLAAQHALIELVEGKFPGCTITRVHVYGEKLEPPEKGHGIRCSAHFTFPGAKYGATYHFGEGDRAWVSDIDVPAFDALYRTA